MSAPYFRLYHDFWKEHLSIAEQTSRQSEAACQQWIAWGIETLRQRGKIFFFGNGGSAADAQHLAAEFSVRFSKDRSPLAALALTTDTSVLTACGNDYGFEHIFSRQIHALGQRYDLAVGISTSGKSPNVLNGLQAARTKEMKTVLLTGSELSLSPERADLIISVPSRNVAHIQEMHITLGHLFCAAVETDFMEDS